MKREEVLNNINTKFKDDIIDVFDKTPTRIYIEIKSEALVPMALYIFRDVGARFNIASGVDTRQCFEILYHFIVEEINLIISLRIKLSKENPVIDALAPYFEGANWIEREMHEMFGIDFKGHPDLSRLLLPDEWPEGVYPLRREYEEWDKSAIRDRGV